MKSAVRVVVASFLILVAFGGCSGSSGAADKAKTSPSAGGKNGPGATLQSMFMAANAGKYTEAETHMSPEALTMIKGIGSKTMWDDITHNGTLTQVEILKEDVRGEGAAVKVRYHYKDGAVNDQDVNMVQKDGKWLYEN